MASSRKTYAYIEEIDNNRSKFDFVVIGSELEEYTVKQLKLLNLILETLVKLSPDSSRNMFQVQLDEFYRTV